jgi:hypothetical protein
MRIATGHSCSQVERVGSSLKAHQHVGQSPQPCNDELRHAFDTDHLAAIDNTTRKLMNDGQHPRRV